jgi:hypothetical protein
MQLGLLLGLVRSHDTQGTDSEGGIPMAEAVDIGA